MRLTEEQYAGSGEINKRKTVRVTFRPETRARVHAKYDGSCAYCGVPITLTGMQIDHIHPRSLGGTNAIENLNPACRACNNHKGVWSLEEFRHNLSQQVERCRQYSANFRTAERFGLLSVVKSDVVFHFEVSSR